MKRRGYSIYQRNGKGPFYVTWTDGRGKVRTMKASMQRPVANEIGRAKAAEADRVRTGTLDPSAAVAASAARLAIADHVKAWRKALGDKNVTAQHANQNESRVSALLKAAGVTVLAELTAERIQSALAGRSTPQNARHYLTAVRAFVKWCMETDRLTRSPILAVRMPAVAGQTFKRQPLSDADVFGLIDATATRKAKTPFVGRDRSMFYRLLAYTGLRKSEAASLTRESFDLAAWTVTLLAAYSKHRREDVLTIPPQIRDVLAAWLADKPAGRRVFKIGKGYRWERTFRIDCRAAGVTVKAGCRLGLHSLRRWFITGVARAAGVGTAQRLARHSTPALTAGYMDLTLADTDAALAKLPGAKEQTKTERKQA